MANNHSRIFVYWYVVKIWKWVLILLTFECLIESGIAINIIIVMLQAFITYGDWLMTNLLNMLCF